MDCSPPDCSVHATLQARIPFLKDTHSWSGLPLPSSGDPPNPGVESGSPALQVDYVPQSHQGSPPPSGLNFFLSISAVCLFLTYAFLFLPPPNRYVFLLPHNFPTSIKATTMPLPSFRAEWKYLSRPSPSPDPALLYPLLPLHDWKS